MFLVYITKCNSQLLHCYLSPEHKDILYPWLANIHMYAPVWLKQHFQKEVFSGFLFGTERILSTRAGSSFPLIAEELLRMLIPRWQKTQVTWPYGPNSYMAPDTQKVNMFVKWIEWKEHTGAITGK